MSTRSSNARAVAARLHRGGFRRFRVGSRLNGPESGYVATDVTHPQLGTAATELTMVGPDPMDTATQIAYWLEKDGFTVEETQYLDVRLVRRATPDEQAARDRYAAERVAPLFRMLFPE